MDKEIPAFRRIDSCDYKVSIDGVEYEWIGGFGGVLKSWESRVREMDVRIIGHVIFYAYSVEHWWFWKRVVWKPQEDIDSDWLCLFRRAVFK